MVHLKRVPSEHEAELSGKRRESAMGTSKLLQGNFYFPKDGKWGQSHRSVSTQHVFYDVLLVSRRLRYPGQKYLVPAHLEMQRELVIVRLFDLC